MWKKTRQAEEEVGRQHQGMDRPGVRQGPEGSGEQEKKMEKTGCKIICGAPTTFAVKGLMMMMMNGRDDTRYVQPGQVSPAKSNQSDQVRSTKPDKIITTRPGQPIQVRSAQPG